MPYDLTVQIVNYKTKVFLDPLLKSLFKDVKDQHLKIEINILDNDSGDLFDDLAKKWQGHNVRVFYADRNGGFSYGHNKLAAKAKGKYILILNPDILFIEPKTISRLIQSSIKYGATVVGPRLFTPISQYTTDLRTYSKGQLTQQPWDHQRLHARRYTADNKTIDCNWVSGAAFLIQKKAFLDIGQFDERFFLYEEEVELCHRLRRRGHKVLYNPHIIVLHYRHAVATKKSMYYYKSLFLSNYLRLRNTISTKYK